MPHSIRRMALALAAIVALCWADTSHATSLALIPADSTITVADEIVVRLEATGVTDLKGMQVELTFDPSVLQVLSASRGTLLPPGAAGSFFQSFLSNAPGNGHVQCDAAVLTGSSSGSGTLLAVRFRALAIGVSPITVTWVDLRDSNNASTTPGGSSATIRVFGPVATQRASWTKLKNLYR